MPPMDPQVSHPKLPMILAIGITAIVFGLGGYVIASMANNNDTTDLLTSTGTSTASTSTATPTAKATATASSTASTTETYSNSKYKFTLSYPSEWKVKETTTEGDDGKGGVLVSFTKGTSSDPPALRFEVNPVGRGLQTAEFYYAISYKNGTISIGNKTAGEASEYSDVKKGAVYFDDPNADGTSIKINGNSYTITAVNISNETDLATILGIVSSFKLN